MAAPRNNSTPIVLEGRQWEFRYSRKLTAREGYCHYDPESDVRRVVVSARLPEHRLLAISLHELIHGVDCENGHMLDELFVGRLADQLAEALIALGWTLAEPPSAFS